MAGKRKDPGPSREDLQRQALLRQALALLLPEGDAGLASRELWNRLGSFSNILLAPPEALEGIPGMTEKSARFLHLALELARAWMKDTAGEIQGVLDFRCFVELLRPEFFGRKTECVAVILLDSADRQLYTGRIFEGSISSVQMNIRRLMSLCINYNASGLVLAHNHPTGSVYPSIEDILLTGRSMLALMDIDIELSDHIIFTDDQEFSFARSGLLDNLRGLALSERRDQVAETRKLGLDYLQRGGR